MTSGYFFFRFVLKNNLDDGTFTYMLTRSLLKEGEIVKKLLLKSLLVSVFHFVIFLSAIQGAELSGNPIINKKINSETPISQITGFFLDDSDVVVLRESASVVKVASVSSVADSSAFVSSVADSNLENGVEGKSSEVKKESSVYVLPEQELQSVFGAKVETSNSKPSTAKEVAQLTPLELVGRIGGGLVVVMVMIFSFGAIAKKMIPGVSAKVAPDAMTVLCREQLGPKHALMLVRVGERILVLSSGESGVRTLSEISAPDEVASVMQRCNSDEKGSGRFRGLLHKHIDANSGVSDLPVGVGREAPMVSRVSMDEDSASSASGVKPSKKVVG